MLQKYFAVLGLHLSKMLFERFYGFNEDINTATIFYAKENQPVNR